MSDTLICQGSNFGKRYRFSGSLTSVTIKNSEADAAGINFRGLGIDEEGNTPTNSDPIGGGNNKLRLYSGEFTDTVKDSMTMGASNYDVSKDSDGNTPWSNSWKTMVTSGQFEATIKSSKAGYDTLNKAHKQNSDFSTTLDGGDTNDKMYLHSGYSPPEGTLKDSQPIMASGTAFAAFGVTADGNTIQTDSGLDDGYLVSGQFTGTLKGSISFGASITNPLGCHDTEAHLASAGGGFAIQHGANV